MISLSLLFKLQTGSPLHTAACNKQELNKYLIVKQCQSKFFSLLGRAGDALIFTGIKSGSVAHNFISLVSLKITTDPTQVNNLRVFAA